MKSLKHQLLRFGIVGATAAAVHLFSVVIIVQTTHINPLIANCYGFSIAFFVSYFGHRFVSFSHQKTTTFQSFPRFLIVALSGFGLNQILFYILLRVYNLYYPIALFIVLVIVSLFIFILSKFWAFTYHHKR